MIQRDSAASDLRILVVDDEDDVREVFRLALARKGYDVTSTDNGAEAIETAAEERFQLAFVDVAMPGMDGLETLRGLKEVSPDTNVVMITAFLDSALAPDARQDRVTDCLTSGARGCLRKPFGMDTILKTAEYFAQ